MAGLNDEPNVRRVRHVYTQPAEPSPPQFGSPVGSGKRLHPQLVAKRLPTKEECDRIVNATIDGDMEIVSTLIDDGVDMNAVIYEKQRMTPLHISSHYGHSNIVKKLLTSNVIACCVDLEKCTPLYNAAECGHNDVVKLLLAANADPNNICIEQCTPLYAASAKGFNDVVKSLIAANADVNCVCKDQCTPLYIASIKGFNDVVKSLIAANADVNYVCKYCCTPLYVATHQGHYDVVRTLMEANADKNLLNEMGISPFQCAVKEGRSKIVEYFVKEIKVDITSYDQTIQQQIDYLLELEAAIERSKTETRIEMMQSRTPQDSYHGTLKEVNENYMDGCISIVDPKVVLLGCEGSGKTSLIDTLVGNSFRNTSPTEGADQKEISVTTSADWKIISAEDKIADIQKQHSEFFISVNELFDSFEVSLAAQPPSTVAATTIPTQHNLYSIPVNTPTMPTSSISTDEPSSSTVKRDAMAEPPKSLPQIPLNPHSSSGKLHKTSVYITKEEFQESKTMKEKYNRRRRYFHLWDFTGQQIFHHMHGLFVSEDVVCLIVFNAGKSLFTVPDKRYPGDITPIKSAIKAICYYMEMISARVSKRSTEGDDLSEFLPTFILIGTHIDELHPDIKVAMKLAFHHFVPALMKELASKPFAKHIAGSKNNELFTEVSSSIFFISNKDEMRDPLVIGKIKSIIFKAASITKQSRPIRLVEMERKFMLLAHQDKISVIDKPLAKEVAESCGFSCTDQELVNVLNYFHQKGILLHFHNVPAVSNMIILSPQWLAKLLTYVLTTLRSQAFGPLHAVSMQKLQATGLLEEGLLEWSVQQFIMDEAARGNKMVKMVGSDVANLLINFKLMANVSNTSLASQSPRALGLNLFLVPHLLPKQKLLHSIAFGYYFFYYFPAKFIPKHLVDQLIVKCAEWNRSKRYDILKSSYQWVCLELGKHQIYELNALFDHSVIAIKIIPDPNLSSEVKEKTFSDSNELVRSVQKFINDLMREHMTATFARAPAVCYIPCSQCRKMHLSVEKAAVKSNIYCPVSRVHADITDYHNILSADLESRTVDDSLFDDDASDDVAIGTAEVTMPNISQQKPKMRHLNNMVIPKIAAYWKKVADALEFEVWKIKTIEKKYRNDPEDCCDELLREWLSSALGLHPKTWSTLINALKEVKQLTAITETIETDIQTIA